jgi:hypothetical protein
MSETLDNELNNELNNEYLEESNNDTVSAFKSILNFITALHEEFGTRNRPLRLYMRLISQTTFSHNKAIKKHVDIFTEFCIKNRDTIYQQSSKLLQPKIKYSDRVFLDMEDIFRLADKEQQKVMWQHILTISALVDSTGKAKQILKQMSTDNNESNFLTNIIEKVEQNVNVNSENPMQAIGDIMSSGIFTDLIGSMNEQINSGQLDMSKMFSVVQNMVGTISNNNPEVGQLMSGLMNNLPTNLSTIQENEPSEKQ